MSVSLTWGSRLQAQYACLPCPACWGGVCEARRVTAASINPSRVYERGAERLYTQVLLHHLYSQSLGFSHLVLCQYIFILLQTLQYVKSWIYKSQRAFAYFNTLRDWFWTVEIHFWKQWGTKITLPQITLVTIIHKKYFLIHLFFHFCSRGLSLCVPLNVNLRVKRTWNQTTDSLIVLQDLTRDRCALAYDPALGHQQAYIATAIVYR